MLVSEAGEGRGRVLYRGDRGCRRIRARRSLAELTLVLALRANGDDGGRPAERDGGRDYRCCRKQRREQDQKGGHPRQHDFRVADGRSASPRH